MRCSVCGKEAIIELPVYKKRLCAEHYVQWYYEKTRDFTKKLTRPGDKIALAISGGKDSLALALFFSHYQKEFDVDVFMFHVDLGIPGSSQEARKVVEKFSRDLGMDLYVYDLKKELGRSLPEFRKGSRPPCSVCGIIKRYLMNRIPRELGANKIATGHNLDDQVENFFKNWLSQHWDWIAKQKPILPGQGKLLTRIKPLFERTEKENTMYLVAHGYDLPGYKCRYSQPAKWKPIVEMIENEHPGFKLAMIKSIERFDYPVSTQELGECKVCGEPTSQEVCAFCKILGLNK